MQEDLLYIVVGSSNTYMDQQGSPVVEWPYWSTSSVGFSSHLLPTIRILIPGRAAAGMVELPGLSPFMVVAVYFQVGLRKTCRRQPCHPPGDKRVQRTMGGPFSCWGGFQLGSQGLDGNGFHPTSRRCYCQPQRADLHHQEEQVGH